VGLCGGAGGGGLRGSGIGRVRGLIRSVIGGIDPLGIAAMPSVLLLVGSLRMAVPWIVLRHLLSPWLLLLLRPMLMLLLRLMRMLLLLMLLGDCWLLGSLWIRLSLLARVMASAALCHLTIIHHQRRRGQSRSADICSRFLSSLGKKLSNQDCKSGQG